MPIALWAAVVALYLVFCLTLKVAPLAALMGVFVAHGVSHWRRWHRIETVTQAVALCLMAGTAAGTAAYALATWLVPPHTAEGHGLMPIGQIAVGLFAGLAATVVVLVLYLRRWRHDPVRIRTRILVHLGGLATLGVAGYTALRLWGG